MILLRVSLIFLVLFLLPDWYIYKTYLTSLHHRRWKRAYWLPTVLLLLILVIFLIGHDTLHEYFGTYLIVALCVTIPKTVFMLTSILLKLFRRLVKRPVPHGWIALFAILIQGAHREKNMAVWIMPRRVWVMNVHICTHTKIRSLFSDKTLQHIFPIV